MDVRVFKLLAAALLCALLGTVVPAYADHKPNHPEPPGQGGGAGGGGGGGKPDNPGKPGDNYSASVLTTLRLSVQGPSGHGYQAGDRLVVLAEVLSDAIGDGPLALAGRVQLRANDALLGTEPVRDGMATFELPAGSLGEDGASLSARFLPAEGSHHAASATTAPVTVAPCEECADAEVALASAEPVPAHSDPTWRWMALALLVLVAGGALLWLMAGGPLRRPAGRR